MKHITTPRQFVLQLPKRAKPEQTKRLRWPRSFDHKQWARVNGLAKERGWFWLSASSAGLLFIHLPCGRDNEYYR